MEILTLIAFGAINVVCFVIGAKIGQTVSRGEDIKIPHIDPIKTAEELANRREAERESDKLNAILRNIENYDGTGLGQEDVPRG